ncbi:MAG: TolC family outer membrane protein [Novosphingobium sp.]
MRRRAGPLAGPIVGAALASAGIAAPASADDLRQALELAYRSNPTLLGARADLRATDEQVAIEKADGRPNLSSTAQHTEFLKQSSSSFTSPDRAFNASVSLGVPIYSGGAVRNAVLRAKTRVTAGRADLRGTESAIFSQVVSAYMDVMQNQAIVGLNRSNVQVLNVNLQATSDRFQIGNLTRTDVAQSQSRLALARGDTRSAEANLASARETYIRLVGKPPQDLQPPPPLPNLPANAEEAVAFALDNNPDVLAARERSRAAGYDVRVAGSRRLPRLSLFSGGGYNNYFGTLGSFSSLPAAQSDTTAQVGLRASLPLYQGGLPAALRRQAQQREGSAMEQEIAVERDVIAQTRAAFSSWQASLEIIASSQTAVDAANLGLEGVRAENGVGNRTILDILNAEQELLQAQVRLVTARRNAYVAGFSVLAAMGRAEARDLGLEGGPLYDPDVHYRQVRGKWFDWDSDPAPVAQASRTVDTPVQDGDIPAMTMPTTGTRNDAPGG